MKCFWSIRRSRIFSAKSATIFTRSVGRLNVGFSNQIVKIFAFVVLNQFPNFREIQSLQSSTATGSRSGRSM